MDKIELSREDITALLDWRDEHKELVRSLPAPKKAIEIVFKHNAFRIKGIRDGDTLRLHLSNGFVNLGKAEFTVSKDKTLVLKRGKMEVTEESFRSVLTVYCSLMALMTYGRVEYGEEIEPADKEKVTRSQKATKRSPRKPVKRTTYILRRDNGTLLAAPMSSHASPKGIFTVRGHYRHYKSGKVVWIAEYRKGTGKKKSKTYKMGGKNDDRATD